MVKKTETNNFNNLETPSQRILLEEFRLLEDRYSRNRDQGIVRMNFFITAASVALGGVLVFGSNNNLPSNYFRIILLVTLVLLGTIGLDLFNYLVLRDISADRYQRGLARIRSYFIKLDPQIEHTFVTRYSDEPTGYITTKRSGILRTAQVIEGFLLGLATTISLTFLPLAPEIAISIGLAIALLIFVVLEINAIRRFRAALKKIQKSTKGK